MIKPEFWDDEKLATQTSRDARFIFIGLWNHSDDYGVVKGNDVWLKNHILAYEDSLSIQEFSGWLTELERMRCILPFEQDGEKYYYIRTFTRHQKVNRPSKQRNPAPPKHLLEDSVSAQGALTDETETETETETEAETEEYSLSPQGVLTDEIEPIPVPGPDFVKTDLIPKDSGFNSSTMRPYKIRNDPSTSQKDIPGLNLKAKGYQVQTADYFEDIKNKCCKIDKLPVNGLDSVNPHAWVQYQIKKKSHPGAISLALGRIIENWDKVEKTRFGYLNHIVGIESGNFNEAETIKIHNDLKKLMPEQLVSLTRGLLKKI